MNYKTCKKNKRILALVALAVAAAPLAKANDIRWQGGTSIYNVGASWIGGVVPGSGDNAFNDTGSNSVVQLINPAPAWSVNDFRAGNDDGTSGSYLQDGPDATVNGWFRMGLGNGSTGFYTLNNGTLTCNNQVHIGEHGAGVLTINGGTFNGRGNPIGLGGSGDIQGGPGSSGTVNQFGGTVDSNDELWLGNGSGSQGFYNLYGGTLNLHNWLAIGRTASTGTMVVTNGVFTKDGNGNFLVATGNGSVGTLNQSGGTVNCQSQMWIPENGDGNTLGTYSLSGTAILNVNDYVGIGRGNGSGVLNISDSAVITKAGGNNIYIGDGGNGTVNQTNGTIIMNTGDMCMGGSANATWNMYGGTNYFNTLRLPDGTGQGNFNLMGGVLQVNAISCQSQGFGYLDLNGGTIQAKIDNANFMFGLYVANVDAGGAIIDSQNHNITIAQDLAGNGGSLTKKGTGTLTLTGANGFSGASVEAGTLVLGPSTTGAGDYVVADNAALSVAIAPSLNSTFSIGNLTLGNSVLAIDLGNYGNPTAAPVTLSGALAANGTVTINLADSLPQPGSFPLVQYQTITGAGNFVIGSLPLGVEAALSTNGNTIALTITSVSVPRWNGQINGDWDIGSTENWINIGTGLPAVYGQGNPVLFDDNAQGTTDVNLNATVTPSSLQFANASKIYTVTGSGKISGSIGLTKSGAGTASLLNTGGNDFTGPVVITGGTLKVASLANGGLPSGIGASPADPANLVLANGSLGYTGPDVSIDRGYSIQNTNSGIDAEGNLTLTGPATATPGSDFIKTGSGTLTYASVGTNFLSGTGSAGYRVAAGTVIFDGSAGVQTNLVQNGLSVVGASGTASVIMTNTTVTTTGDMSLGNVPSTKGALTLNNGTTLNVGSWFTFSDSAGSVGTVTMNSGSTLNVNNGRLFLCSAPNTMCTFNINGGVINKSGDYFAVVNGNWNGGDARTGVVNQVDGTVNSSSELWVGDQGGVGSLSLGIYNLSGGTLTINNWFGIGRDGATGNFNMTGGTLNKGVGGDMVIGRGVSAGTFTLSGGTLNKDNVNPLIVGQGGGRGEFDQTGGTLNNAGEFWLGVDNGTIATNNISGTAVVNQANWMSIGRGGLGVVNISGGTFNKTDNGNFVVGDGGTGVLNQSGGALNVNSEFWIAQAGGSSGTVNLSGGTITNNSWLAVGREGGSGTLNISGGRFVVNANGGNTSIAHGGGTGTVNVTSGSIDTSSGQTWIGEDSNAGVWNMNGGTAILGYVQLAKNANATGTLNLNGGTLTAGEITTGSSGASTLNFNSGTLIAGASPASFLHGLTAANILAGGAVIDSGTNDISFDQALLGDVNAGTLTKNGSGTLRLNGVNTYTGMTTVSAGTLAGTGTIAGPVTVDSGAALAVGAGSVGTLTINNTLTLAAGSKTVMQIIPGSNDQITGLTGVSYAGSLVVNCTAGSGVYKLFSSAAPGTGSLAVTILPAGTGTFNPATGELTVVQAMPTTINPVTVSGGNLNLTGAGGLPGGTYSVLTSTNVAAPLADWTTNTTGVFSETGTFTNAIPVSSDPVRFFSIKTP